MKNRPVPGTKVRLTGDFLRNTGQAVGGEGSRRWVVEPCDCGLCKHGPYVRVDQTMPDFSRRHLHYGNLERAR